MRDTINGILTFILGTAFMAAFTYFSWSLSAKLFYMIFGG